MLSKCPCASTYLLWSSICPILSLIFYIGCLISYNQIWEFLMYCGYNFFIWYKICQYYILVCNFFHSHNCAFLREGAFKNFEDTKFIIFFFYGSCFLWCIYEIFLWSKLIKILSSFFLGVLHRVIFSSFLFTVQVMHEKLIFFCIHITILE